MNRRVAGLVAAAGIYLVGCGLRIRINEQATTTVEAGSVVEGVLGDFGFGDFLNMDLTNAQELRNQGVQPGDIEDVKMLSLELEARSPDGADLSFIESMELYVEAPGLPRELLAFADAFPEGEPVVAFDLPELDLTDYVVSESMSITTEVSGRRPSQDTEVEARFSLSVVAKAGAACD